MKKDGNTIAFEPSEAETIARALEIAMAEVDDNLRFNV